MNKPFSRTPFHLAAAVTAAALTLSACSPDELGFGQGAEPAVSGKQGQDPAAEPEKPTAFAPRVEGDPLGFFTSERKDLEEKGLPTDKVVVADAATELAAARFAVENGLPMLGADQVGELAGLDATEVVAFGEVDTTGFTGTVTPGVLPEAPEQLNPYEVAQAVAQAPARATSKVTALVTPNTPLADIATARAAGATVLVLTVGDPREISESMAAVKAGNTVAIGPDFGTQEQFQAKVELVSNGELPGGGGLVFPGRRMIALYGHPSGPALGVMGEQDPAGAVARVQELVGQYQQLTQYPVIPAFEIIATVASSSPGDDGDYANETEPADLVPYIDAITQAGGYAVLDLQPGRASLVEQAKIYEDLLKRPNVGLALDPEWKIGPDEVPMTNIGHVEAAEVDEVSQWLADLVRDNNLPQKAFVLHQFQLQMIRNREALNLDHPELAFVLHADGHGAPGVKMETWDAMRQDLQPEFFMAWKNFIDEDSPMHTPAETYSINPRPWFVSYQ
ncbi:hypothetical protein CPHO_06945 [Corynebacterium phocae]|uniref:Cell wall-binding repeat 2 family protein n=1 Tax=Corynebacterium phocae TaxID=161895 RepID=A0A1L7D415_9CORY|nr:hypothetical protein [Corynebacterium phocae]APT92672.1 hypothetical protein CPHO_06945 [Corynebacterium phocae]KAA8723560.1 cell wall-binding repeat-containing protein [Corynebacterium phocae]